MPLLPLPGTVPAATIWRRLEPLALTSGIEDALQARIADPLWLLARQWQFGELAAEDAGSPIDVVVGTEAAPLSRVRLGPESAPARGYDPGQLPLEAVVEAEPVRRVDPGLAAEAGQQLLRMLSVDHQDLRGALLDSFPYVVPLPEDADDPAGTYAHWMLQGAVPDARAVVAALRPSGSLAARLGLSGSRATSVDLVGTAWLAWFDRLVVDQSGAPESAPPAWVPDRLEHQFAVAAQGPSGVITLAAERYADGHLDWPDVSAVAPLSGGSAPPTVSRAQRLLPTPVRFPGMPARRFWEIEDVAVSFAGLDPGLTDVGQVLLAEFGLVYGEDWFAVPVETVLGSLLTVTGVTVTDTFGVMTQVPMTPRQLDGGPPWSVGELGTDDATLTAIRDVVTRLPSVTGGLQGSPVERVEFGRDEMANMVWAVEHVVPGAAGTAVDRSAELARVPDVSGVADPALTYRLGSPIPAHWVPYIPTQTPGEPLGVTRLERRATEDSRSVLTRATPLIQEAEVPAGGVVVERTWQRARWIDGRVVLWLGRRVSVGAGPVASGLAWDRVVL